MGFSYRQIAAAAGVSTTTVHRVLTGANKEVWASSSERGTKVRRIAEEHGFRPNGAARSMRLRRTDTIGIVVKHHPDRTMLDPSLFETIMGVSYVLESSGRMMNMVRVHDDFNENNLPRAFRESLLDAVIVVGDMPSMIYSYISSFFKRYAFMEANCYEPLNCIRRDEALSSGLAVDSLVQSGRGRLVYSGPVPESGNSHFSERQRMECFRKRAEDLSVEAEVHRTESDGYGSVARMLRSIGLPDRNVGIVAYDHRHALRILSESAALALVPGRDFGLAACDSTSSIFGVWPALSTSVVSRFDMGADCAELLVGMIDARTDSFKSRLVKPIFIKGSTA